MNSSAPRIFCIGKNYGDHIKEFDGIVPGEPVIFCKHPDCIVPEGELLISPIKEKIHYECEVVVRLKGNGKLGADENPIDRVDAVTLGLDLTLRTRQGVLKNEGHPWDICKAFEKSAPLGSWQPVPANLLDLPFSCKVNGEERQNSTTAKMLWPLPELIKAINTYWTLKDGDILFTGTPAGVGPLFPNDKITISAEELGEWSWEVSPDSAS